MYVEKNELLNRPGYRLWACVGVGSVVSSGMTWVGVGQGGTMFTRVQSPESARANTSVERCCSRLQD